MLKPTTGRSKSRFPDRNFLLLLISVLIQTPAQARDWLSMIGSEVSSGNAYAYAGLLAPVSDAYSGNGWLQRYWLDQLYYEYDNNRTIKASAPGISAALGYTRSGPDHRYTAYLGLGYRNTDLSPDDPGNKARGVQLGAILQLEGERALVNDWKAEAIASYSTADSGYWSRLRMTRYSGRPVNIGGEFVVQGNPEYSSWQVGVTGSGLKIAARTELGLKAGFRHNPNEDTGGYFGFEVAHSW